MGKNTHNKMLPTNDLIIRSALKKILEERHANDEKVRIIEELGIQHGTARVDIAVVNGALHGYEIKSDQDTLQRLPEQMGAFNSVFDKMTLVVGKKHLYEAINMIPDWWGITVAKFNSNSLVTFNLIRDGELNKRQDSVSIARLLWREEALGILKEKGEAKGFYSKTRDLIYEKLSMVFDQENLGEKVRETLFLRKDWRPDSPLILNGG
ncbi:MAG: sce7726 family protein [Candidatus Omnitrophica bacterium]|nr:sce7726 family protein [Candidatus Omnitrophota bacterium]MBU2035068.1 sce7726 family protein [Candidatus Omnitrophota bacterium]